MKNFAIALATLALMTGAAHAQSQSAGSTGAQPAKSPQGTQTDATASTLTRLDLNKDAGIDKTEAASMKGLADVFQQADANRDGKLDEAELAAALNLLK